MSSSNSRGKKTTKTQMELIVNYLEKNNTIVSGKTHPLDAKQIERDWEELTGLLNSVEFGAKKDVKQWKTVSFVKQNICII